MAISWDLVVRNELMVLHRTFVRVGRLAIFQDVATRRSIRGFAEMLIGV